MKALVEFIVTRLANHPDKVAVTESEEDQTVQLKLVVCEEDKGKIIGKQGRVIKAVRALVSAAAAKQGKRAFLEVE
ncbi:MAG: KH domain-containing protein [Elusimicrobia bacterium]|nr:KH domain-containing protein [Elusimicrobiota bacterium]